MAPKLDVLEFFTMNQWKSVEHARVEIYIDGLVNGLRQLLTSGQDSLFYEVSIIKLGFENIFEVDWFREHYLTAIERASIHYPFSELDLFIIGHVLVTDLELFIGFLESIIRNNDLLTRPDIDRLNLCHKIAALTMLPNLPYKPCNIKKVKRLLSSVNHDNIEETAKAYDKLIRAWETNDCSEIEHFLTLPFDILQGDAISEYFFDNPVEATNAALDIMENNCSISSFTWLIHEKNGNDSYTDALSNTIAEQCFNRIKLYYFDETANRKMYRQTWYFSSCSKLVDKKFISKLCDFIASVKDLHSKHVEWYKCAINVFLDALEHTHNNKSSLVDTDEIISAMTHYWNLSQSTNNNGFGELLKERCERVYRKNKLGERVDQILNKLFYGTNDHATEPS